MQAWPTAAGPAAKCPALPLWAAEASRAMPKTAAGDVFPDVAGVGRLVAYPRSSPPAGLFQFSVANLSILKTTGRRASEQQATTTLGSRYSSSEPTPTPSTTRFL